MRIVCRIKSLWWKPMPSLFFLSSLISFLVSSSFSVSDSEYIDSLSLFPCNGSISSYSLYFLLFLPPLGRFCSFLLFFNLISSVFLFLCFRFWIHRVSLFLSVSRLLLRCNESISSYSLYLLHILPPLFASSPSSRLSTWLHYGCLIRMCHNVR